ncbi:MAG: STAS domain-containing protein [Spirochaetota bacterium]
MEGLKLNVTYRGKDNGIAVLCARGYIDSTTIDEIEKKLLEQIAQNRYRIVIDLTDTEYINSSGWGVFLREIKNIREHCGDLFLVGMMPDVRHVYETMEFSRVLRSFDNLEEALESFAREY